MPVPRSDLPGATILLFGGTFDPVHTAHVDLGDKARKWVATSDSGPDGHPNTWLIFVPVAHSPHKISTAPSATGSQRAEMLRLAIQAAHLPQTAVWTDELDRAQGELGPSYTIDTVLRARQWLDVHGGASARLRLLLGADQAAAFHTWRSPHDLLLVAPPVVMLRSPQETAAHMLDHLERAGQWSSSELAVWAAGMAPTPLMSAAATDLRRFLATPRWDDPSRLIPPPVLAYIRANHLYLAGG